MFRAKAVRRKLAVGEGERVFIRVNAKTSRDKIKGGQSDRFIQNEM